MVWCTEEDRHGDPWISSGSNSGDQRMWLVPAGVSVSASGWLWGEPASSPACRYVPAFQPSLPETLPAESWEATWRSLNLKALVWKESGRE